MKKYKKVIQKQDKIESRITFKLKTVYYLELLTPEMMKLLGNIKNKLNNDKTGKNVVHLEISEVVLVYCRIVNNDCHQHPRVFYTFPSNKWFFFNN